MSTVKPTPGKESKQKQSTLNGFFSRKPGPPPSRTPSSISANGAPPATSSPASTALNTPSSIAGSSPLNARISAGTGKDRARASSPLKKSSTGQTSRGRTVEDEDEELSPPPMAIERPGSSASMRTLTEDEDMDRDGSPPITAKRRAKRKIIYAESDGSGSDADAGPSRSHVQAARKPRKSLKASSDDDFEFDDADDALFAAAAEEYEAGPPSPPSPASNHSATPPPRSKKAVPAKKSFSAPKPSRPGPKPIPGSRNSSSFQNSSNMFLTEAEVRRAEEKEKLKTRDEVFKFLENKKDKYGREEGHPDYDPRTILISKKEMSELKPFEKQFWTIKQNHFDTVLFFQKGKFFELYEDDAQIGHQEFDLKLTERVRMKMVGVPEQSFDFWAAKFLAAGYKVGRVDQAETAIGAEMRRGAEQKGATKGKAPPKRRSDDGDDDDKPDKIVRRELKQVFTNGTIVDGAYLTSDDANHCVAIKEYSSDPDAPSSFGICVADASTGEINLTAFEDDVCRTRLETMFRQIRPKELVHAKGNLSVSTLRTLRNILPSSTLWQSFRDIDEFYTADQTLTELSQLFETEDDEPGTKPSLPPAVEKMLDSPLAMEALGGMIYYLQTLNLDKDLITQRNFNVYDPIREGKSLVLDGQTLGHMEVLVNNEGESAGTLLELLQLCVSPFGKRLFRIWLTCPLREIPAINARLDAVEDLIKNQSFTGQFTQLAKALPDLERLISRIHAGSVKQSDFAKVVQSFRDISAGIEDLARQAKGFDSQSIASLLESAPDLRPLVSNIKEMFSEKREDKTMHLAPQPGADEECDASLRAVQKIEAELNAIEKEARKELRSDAVVMWHSAQGGKEIYQLQVPSKINVPRNWTKQSGTQNVSRYYTPETIPLVRALQEARETYTTAKRTFFLRLMAEFDKDREVWSQAVKVIAELDCLVSLAKASANMDEPKCRPTFMESESAFIDFQELRHPSMCLRADFIANDVRLGSAPNDRDPDGTGDERQVLLTGPNMAGKSTLLRMTAAGIIMAQMGCYVPARQASLSPVDKIQTRMGAYDNMFASASTFKVELDECCKILREAGPKSFVILDELGRGTSTYDGMAIAGAVLHHLATHTLPLGFFATHYGSLTDDFAYHPNVRRMHMQTHVDDEQRQVVFLYKLIPGVAESSHGTHVARLAGVPEQVVTRADQVSAEFFQAFKNKLSTKRRSDLPIVAQADFAWLMGLVQSGFGVDGGVLQSQDDRSGGLKGDLGGKLDIIRRAIGRYEVAA